LCSKIVEALDHPWVSPEERLREAEAKARQQAEDEARRLEAEAKRRVAEGEARMHAEAEAKRRAEEEEARKRGEAADRQRAEEKRNRQEAEAKRLAEQEEAFAAACALTTSAHLTRSSPTTLKALARPRLAPSGRHCWRVTKGAR